MTGAIGDWDEESTARQFLRDPGVDTNGIFFLVADDQFIATANPSEIARTAEYTD